MIASRATTWPRVHGIEHALGAGADRVALVPGDCPALDPAELDALLEHPAPAGSVLVVPDRHGTGTNALVLTPPGALAPSFGPGSCQRHLEHARAAGVHGEVVEVPTLALDVDTSEDLDALAQRLAGDPRRRRPHARHARAAGPKPRPMTAISATALAGIPEVSPGDDLAALIAAPLAEHDGARRRRARGRPQGGLQGRRADPAPGRGDPGPARAARWPPSTARIPAIVQVVLDESRQVLRAAHGVLICETRHGFVCANAGVDASNVPGEEVVVMLPLDPDASARRLRARPGRAPGRAPRGDRDRLVRPGVAPRPVRRGDRLRRASPRWRTGAGTTTARAGS